MTPDSTNNSPALPKRIPLPPSLLKSGETILTGAQQTASKKHIKFVFLLIAATAGGILTTGVILTIDWWNKSHQLNLVEVSRKFEDIPYTVAQIKQTEEYQKADSARRVRALAANQKQWMEWLRDNSKENITFIHEAAAKSESHNITNINGIANTTFQPLSERLEQNAEIIFIFLTLWIYPSLCFWIIAGKLKTNGRWMAWVPGLNLLLICRMGNQSAWWLAACCLPYYVGFVITLLLLLQIPKALGVKSPLRYLITIPLVNFFYLGYLTFRSEQSETRPL